MTLVKPYFNTQLTVLTPCFCLRSYWMPPLSYVTSGPWIIDPISSNCKVRTSTFLFCGKYILLGSYYTLWQYGLWSFQMGWTKLEIFLPKNQHTQRKWLSFENLVNGGLRSFQKSVFKVNYFHLLRKNTSNWNHDLVLMLLLVFLAIWLKINVNFLNKISINGR